MPRARSNEARNPMRSHGPDIRGNLSFRAGHAARRSEQSVTARRGSFSGARETSSGSETRRRGTKREIAELRQGKLAVARRRNQTSGRPGLQRTTADACDPRGQTLKRQPLSRGHDQPGPHSALAQGSLLFGEQLGWRHHAECTAMQQILLDLVASAPHRDGEAQRQPTQGEQRDSSAALLQKAHAGKSAAQMQASRLRQAASVCNGVHEPVVKPVLLQREQKRYSGKDGNAFPLGEIYGSQLSEIGFCFRRSPLGCNAHAVSVVDRGYLACLGSAKVNCSNAPGRIVPGRRPFNFGSKSPTAVAARTQSTAIPPRTEFRICISLPNKPFVAVRRFGGRPSNSMEARLSILGTNSACQEIHWGLLTSGVRGSPSESFFMLRASSSRANGRFPFASNAEFRRA